MGKDPKTGTQFYTDVGLKPVTIHLPKEVHAKLRLIAKKQDRSLQKTIRRILIDYAARH